MEDAAGPQQGFRAAINAAIGEITRTKPAVHWIELFEANGIPCGPIYTMDQVFADPQVKHLRMARVMHSPTVGDKEVVASAINISGFSKDIRLPTPEAGSSTDEVLRGVGYSAATIEHAREGSDLSMDSMIAAGTRSYAGGKMLAALEDGVGLITFNQPEKRNAMSIEMWEGLGQILDEFRKDSSVRAVTLTGAGPKAFVSGADISQFEKNRSNADAQKEYDRLTSVGREKLGRFDKPTIARIRGFCLGGGLAIAMQTANTCALLPKIASLAFPRRSGLSIAYGFDWCAGWLIWLGRRMRG